MPRVACKLERGLQLSLDDTDHVTHDGFKSSSSNRGAEDEVQSKRKAMTERNPISKMFRQRNSLRKGAAP